MTIAASAFSVPTGVALTATNAPPKSDKAPTVFAAVVRTLLAAAMSPATKIVAGTAPSDAGPPPAEVGPPTPTANLPQPTFALASAAVSPRAPGPNGAANYVASDRPEMSDTGQDWTIPVLPDEQAEPAVCIPVGSPLAALLIPSATGKTSEDASAAGTDEPADNATDADVDAIGPDPVPPHVPITVPNFLVSSSALPAAIGIQLALPVTSTATPAASAPSRTILATERRGAGQDARHEPAPSPSFDGGAPFAERVTIEGPPSLAPTLPSSASETAVTPPRGTIAPAPASQPAAALPAAAAPSAGSMLVSTIAARPGRIGREMGIEIARRVSAGGEELTVRLNPVEMGRIEVRLSFDEHGSLRAVVGAESAAALDMLRRDHADLSRALADAGVRADAQSFRFDGRSGQNGAGGGEGSQFWHRQQQGGGSRRSSGHAAASDEPAVYHPLPVSGRVNLMA